MIQEFVERFEKNKSKLEAQYRASAPGSYHSIVKDVVELITSDDYGDIDPNRIHTIDDGDYQGTIVFVIGAKNYQPSRYWYVYVSYGSCSGCDTFEAIRGYGDDAPTEQQVKDYMMLALHILQGLKEMD